MKSLIKTFAKKSNKKQTVRGKIHISQEIEKSLKRYDETYRLLEEYDKKSVNDPAVLADSGRLQGTISSFQRSNGS